MQFNTPFSDVVPILSEDEYKRLKSDIERSGMMVPILIDEYDNIIDGHHRVKIANELSIPEFPVEIRSGLSMAEKHLMAWTINANRRQWTQEDMLNRRHELCRVLRQSGMSLRDIGDVLGISHVQVRKDLSGVNPVNTSSVMGHDGKQYPSAIRVTSKTAKKVAQTLAESPAGEVAQRLGIDSADKIATLERLHKSSGKPGTNGTFDEIASSGGFHYGDNMEKWCDFSGDSQETITRALMSVSDYHRSMPHQTRGTGNEEYYTPVSIIELVHNVMGEIDLDPASCAKANHVIGAKKYYSKEDDGLAQAWRGRVWMNPPYTKGKLDLFIDKVMHTAAITEAIILTNNATETEWCQTLQSWADAICLVRGRVKFWGSGGDSPLQGQIVSYRGQHVDEFARQFGKIGTVWTK